MRGAAALLLLAACHRARPGELAEACQPAAASAITADAAAALGGPHEITFVATSGPRAGHALKADLMLREQSDSLRGGHWSPAVQRFVGTLSLSPEEIGAVRMGDPSVADPVQPGVGVYVSSGAIAARVGTLSNMRHEQPIDAGYFALHVREIQDGLIRGSWASGDGRNEVAAGHFCARRR